MTAHALEQSTAAAAHALNPSTAAPDCWIVHTYFKLIDWLSTCDLLTTCDLLAVSNKDTIRKNSESWMTATNSKKDQERRRMK